MTNQIIQLTSEQKDCVDFPLGQQVLIINAGPGTGKTEIIKERVRFIVEQNPTQKQLILVLAFNKPISLDIWRKLKPMVSEKVDFIQKISQFTRRGTLSSLQIMNRTFHSLCYLIFSKEVEKVSEKGFRLIPDKKKKEHIFPLLTEFTSNIVELSKKVASGKKITPSTTLKFIILNNLYKYVLEKKSNNVSEELKQELINEETWKKISIERKELPIIYQNIVYEKYLSEVHAILVRAERLDMYEAIKDFFLREQRKNFWLSFDDLIENVVDLLQKNEEVRKRWRVFDHILVDECQDLNLDKLTMLELLRLPKTTLTFVGDPKQTIYGFRGAESDVFDSIKSIFSNSVQKNITESFRSHQGIVAVANDFSRKFLPKWHYVDLKSEKEGPKPLVFFGEDSVQQVNFLISQIDQIREPARKAILFRQQKSGDQIEAGLKKTTHKYIRIRAGDKDNHEEEIIERLRNLKPKAINNLSSVKELFEKLSIPLADNNLVDFVENFDHDLKIERRWWEEENQLTARQLGEFINELERATFSRVPQGNPEGEIVLSTIHGSKGLEFDYVFLIDVNEEILPSKKAQSEGEGEEEGRVFYVGITRAKKKLYLCSSNQEKISRFIRKLDPNLIEIEASNIEGLPKINSLPTFRDKEKIIGEEGEEKVYELLANSQISFLELVKNWEKIPNLQIDIYAETTQMVYLIEVKKWSWDYYFLHKEKILEQQLNREKTIKQEQQDKLKKEITKNFTYIICFFYWKMAQDFLDFYQQVEGGKRLNKGELLFAFYEEPDEEFAFFAKDQIRKIEDWIK